MMIRGNTEHKKNWFMAITLVFVMVAAGELCGIKAASAATKPIKLRMMMSSEPTAEHMAHIYSPGFAPAEPITRNVMEPLIDYSKGGPVARLATKWEHSPDLTKWRLYLRKGVKFHNGADFTARDVVEYAKWIIDEKKTSSLFERVPVKEAVAVDDYTVDLIFEDPQPLFLITLRYWLIPPLAISRDNRGMAKTHPIGTGSYRFVEWNKGLNIRLTKFEGYWGPKPQIDDVEITFRAEESVRLAALQAGEADWIYSLSPESASHAPKVVRMPSPETVHLRLDESVQKAPILADKRLRLALDYAIDRQALVALYKGFATSSQGQFASPGDFGFNSGLKSRPYDLKKAKDLVKEAGAVGKTLTFVGSTDRFVRDREVCEALSYMIEQTGLKVKLMLMPYAELRKYLRTQGEGRSIMVDILLNTSDTLLEVESRYDRLFTEGGTQMALNDLEPTRLYKEQQAELNYVKRGEKLAKAWAYVYEQAHYIPLFKPEWIWGLSKNLVWNVDIAGRPFFADMRFTD